MDVLKRFDRLRPDDEYLDPATRDRVWSQISGAAAGNADSDASTRDVLDEDLGRQAPLVAIHPTGQPQRHRRALVGVAAVVAIGLGGLVTLQFSRSTEQSSGAAATDQALSLIHI